MCWREPFHWPGPWSTDVETKKARQRYCWWKKSCVHLLRLVVYPIVYRVLAPSQVVQDFFYQQYSIKPNHLKPLQVATTCYVRQNFQKCHWNREPSPFSTLHRLRGKKKSCRDLVIGRDAGMCRGRLLSTSFPNSAIHNFAMGLRDICLTGLRQRW